MSGRFNTKLGEKSFQEKKKDLIDAGFPLPPEIAAADDWGAKEIVKRTERMAEKVYNNYWKI